MDHQASHSPNPKAGDAIYIFLGLYLLLLAFFILLNSISTYEEIKTKKAIESLSSTFAATGPPTEKPVVFTSDVGAIPEAEQLQNVITHLVKTAIPIEEVKLKRGGGQMRVTIPVETMFEPDSARILPGVEEFLNGLAEALSTPPPGFRFDFEATLGAAELRAEILKDGEPLQLSRAGALARDLRRRGAPARSVAVGVEPGDPAGLRLLFYIRDEEGEPVSPVQ